MMSAASGYAFDGFIFAASSAKNIPVVAAVMTSPLIETSIFFIYFFIYRTCSLTFSLSYSLT